MQTVCAHCYVFLPYRRQRTACILCTRCEQNWMQGKAPQRGGKLPDWPGNFGFVSSHSASMSESQ